MTTVTDVPCPPWCAYGPHGPGDDVHMSESYTAPCAETRRDRWHLCGVTNPSDRAFAEDECDELNYALLLLSEDGTRVMVQLRHGDGDLLPEMAVDAAEEYARGILALVALARQGVPS